MWIRNRSSDSKSRTAGLLERSLPHKTTHRHFSKSFLLIKYLMKGTITLLPAFISRHKSNPILLTLLSVNHFFQLWKIPVCYSSRRKNMCPRMQHLSVLSVWKYKTSDRKIYLISFFIWMDIVKHWGCHRLITDGITINELLEYVPLLSKTSIKLPLNISCGIFCLIQQYILFLKHTFLMLFAL